MSHLYLRDTACEPFFKPRNSPSYIVQSILGSLYNPANLNDPCQIQWILINLWTEICRETKLHLCNYGITLKSHFPLHLRDSNRHSKEDYLETWWKGAKWCSPLHCKRHVECKTLVYIMTRRCWLGISNHSLYTASFLALENRKQSQLALSQKSKANVLICTIFYPKEIKGDEWPFILENSRSFLMLLFCVSCPSYECSLPCMYLGTSFCCREAFRLGNKKAMCCWGPKITSDPALVWIELLEVNRSSFSVRTSESDYKVVKPLTTPLRLPAALLNRWQGAKGGMIKCLLTTVMTGS